MSLTFIKIPSAEGIDLNMSPPTCVTPAIIHGFTFCYIEQTICFFFLTYKTITNRG